MLYLPEGTINLIFFFFKLKWRFETEKEMVYQLYPIKSDGGFIFAFYETSSSHKNCKIRTF